EVVEVNQAIVDDPAVVNVDPQGAGWFFKLRLRDTKAMDGLMDEAAYKEVIRQATPLDFGRPLSERGVLDRMRATANKNRVLTSLIGQGYHGTIMPPA